MPKLKLRIQFDNVTFGPGKAALLQGIAETGSISAAGRRMEMSYRRAWSLVEEMNAAFNAPLVISARGGAGGGGAQLTAEGAAALQHFRAIEAATLSAANAEIAGLQAMLKAAT